MNKGNKQDNIEKDEHKRLNKTKVIKVNLSLLVGIIVAILIFVVSLQVIKTTKIGAEVLDNLSGDTAEESLAVTWVESTEIDEDTGEYIKVPVPYGYIASKIEGETGVSTGFVIYEDNYNGEEIDWDEIIVDEKETDEASENSTDETSITSVTVEITNMTSGQEIEIDDESLEDTTINDIEENIIENLTNNTDVKTTEEDSSDDIEESNNTTNNTIDEEDITTDNTVDTDETDIEDEIIDEENDEEPEVSVASVDDEISIISDDESTYYLSDYYSETTASNIWDLQCSVNQYVWVPVSEEDLEEIYRIDSNGKYWGITYSNYSTVYSTAGEPTIDLITGSDIDSSLISYLNGSTRYELLVEELETDFYKTIESIKEYGGFYIARYETGDLSLTEAVVEKNNSKNSGQIWYVKYEKCKGLSGDNDNVTTSMIWGCLWDCTLRWLYDSEAKISTGDTLTEDMIWTDSSDWGNYYDVTFDYYTAYNSLSTKLSSEKGTSIPTGSSEYTKVNNIYDLSGNSAEMTLESFSSKYRCARGGRYNNSYNGPARCEI